MQLHSIIYDHSNIIRSISSDRNIVASGGEDNTVYLNDVSDPSSITQLTTLTDHTAIVRAVELKGDVLATGGEDNTIYVYDISDPTSPTLKATITDPTNNVSSLSIYDNALFVGSTDSNVYVYDIANLDAVSLINTELQSAGVLSLSAKSVTQTDDSEAEVLAVGLTGGNTELYDISTKTGFVSLETKSDHTADVNSVSIGDSGLATGSTDNDIRIYDLTNASSLIPNRYTVDDYTDSVFDVEISNNLLVAGGRDNYVRIYNILDLGNPIVLDEDNVHADWIYAVSITKDILSTGSRDYTVRVNDVSGYANLLGLTASLKTTFVHKLYPEMTVDRYRVESSFGEFQNDYNDGDTLLNINNVLYSGENNNLVIYDILDPSNPVFLSTITDHSGAIRTIKSNNDVLATGSTDDTVKLYDISDTFNPSLLYNITDHTDQVRDLDINNNILVTGSKDDTSNIYDISDPSNPNLLTTITGFDNEINGVIISDNILIFAIFGGGDRDYIKIYDISDPSNPVFLSEKIGRYATNVDISDSRNLIATSTWYGGCSIHDISDPSNPNWDIAIIKDPIELNGDKDVVSFHTSVYLDDEFLITGSRNRLVSSIYDISDPANPVLINLSDFNDEYSDNDISTIHRIGNYIYLKIDKGDTKIVNIYDIVNGSDLQEINYYLNDNLIKTVSSDFIKVHELNFTEEEAEYLTNGRNFLDVELVDQSGVSDKTTLAIIAEVYEKPYPGNSILIKDTEYKVTDLSSTRDDYTVTLDKPLEDSLTTDDVIELTNLKFEPEVFVTDDPNYTPSNDEYLPMEYKGTRYEDEDVFGNQEKATDEYELRGTEVTGQYAHFKVVGKRSSYKDGINVEGGDRFGGMVLENSVDLLGAPNLNSLVIKGNLMIIRVLEEGLRLYDITDVTNPVELSRINGPISSYESENVYIEENIICSFYEDLDNYIVNFDLYNISDPSNPELLSENSITYAESTSILAGVLSNGLLIVSIGKGLIRIYDISDPSNPVSLSDITDFTDEAKTVFVHEQTLIHGTRYGQVRLHDISDPSNPVFLTKIEDHTDQVFALYVEDNILATGSYDNTAKLYDISDPSNPNLLYTLSDHTSFLIRTYIDNKVLFTSAADGKLFIYDISDPSEPKLLSDLSSDITSGAARGVYTNDDVFVAGIAYGTVNFYTGLRSEFEINRPWISRPRSIFRFKEDLTS